MLRAGRGTTTRRSTTGSAPDERYVGGVFADYEITPAIKPYLEFMFMDDNTVAQIAPSGNFGNTFSINCDNPFMARAGASAIVCEDPEI